MARKYKIAIAGAGCVGLSNAMLLAKYNDVRAIDFISEKAFIIKQSPIVVVELFLGEIN